MTHALPILSWIEHEPAVLAADAEGPFSVLVDDFGAPNGEVVALVVATNAEIFGPSRFYYVASCEPHPGERPQPRHIFGPCPDSIRAVLRSN